MIGSLIGTVASRHRNTELFGTITTDSVDPNYIGTTVRATAGELTLDGDLSDTMYLDEPFLIEVGMFFEFESSTSFFAQTRRILFGNHESGTEKVYFMGNAIFFLGVSFPTTNVLNTFYKVRIVHVSTGSYEVFKDDVSLGIQNIGISAFEVVALGRAANVSFSYISKHKYLNLNGKVFNFNETGNDPKVIIG